MDMHFAVLFFCSVSLKYLGPQHTVGTHLCHLHEIVLADSYIKTNLWSYLIDCQAFSKKLVNIFSTYCQGDTHFLSDCSAGVCEHVSIDTDSLDVRNLGLSENICKLHIGVLGNEPCATTDITCRRVIVQ